ncbi:MAG: dihydropteroate synthase [Acidimicrobiales bacterium]
MTGETGPTQRSALGDRGRHRPLVMGILNVTPDSFYDGGLYFPHERAISRAKEMVEQGADIVDIGGESSRPGAGRVDVQEELRRVLPVVETLAGSIRISIDTVKPEVARAAVGLGATLINDISGDLWKVAAENGVGWVAMHMQGEPAHMQEDPRYDDVVRDVYSYVAGRAKTALAAGAEEVWVDPGIGFGKTASHNVALLACLGELVGEAECVGAKGVLVGTSRKSFLGELAASNTRSPLTVDQRLEGSIATEVWSMAKGAKMVRVHDVLAASQAASLVGDLMCNDSEAVR